jgi:hypothetical protein
MQGTADSTHRRGRKRAALAVVTIILFLSGCGERTYTFLGAKRAPRKGQLTKEELTEALDRFEESATALVAETSTQIQRLEPDRKVKRSDLIKNVRIRQALSTMLEQTNPIIAFLEVWGLTVRFREYVESGEGSILYGDHQDLIIEMARELEARLENIGRRFLSEPEFDEARRRIRRFAAQNPIRESFANLVVYATEARPGEPPPFADIIAIPMAPFTALRGVDRTASAIYSIRESMDHIADVVEQMPESVRWEWLLLLAEMEDAAVIESLLTSISTLAESSTRFADTADALPGELREQVASLVEEIDERQANIQATLDKTEQTAAVIEESLAAAKDTIEAAGETTRVINETAREWESAVEATNELVAFARQWSQERPKKDPNSNISVRDYQATALTVTESATELRALLAEAQDLLGSNGLTARIEDMDGRAAGLIDHLFWRLVQLVVVTVVLVVTCRFVLLRFNTKRSP